MDFLSEIGNEPASLALQTYRIISADMSNEKYRKLHVR